MSASLPSNYNLELYNFSNSVDSLSIAEFLALSSAGDADPFAMSAHGTVETLLGNDRLYSQLEIALSGTASTAARGLLLEGGTLLMGAGRDTIDMNVTVASDVPSGSAEVYGLDFAGGARIDMGGGNDLVRGAVEATATGAGAQAVAIGIRIADGSVLAGGTASDVFRGIATATSGETPVAIGIQGGTLDYGPGKDKTHGWGYAEGAGATAVAYDTVRVLGGQGPDHVCGTATAIGDGGSAVAFRDGYYDGGTELDQLWATAIADGKGVEAIGISHSYVDLGAGNDEVKATITVDGSGRGCGIVGSTFQLGGGNDSVVVRAPGYGVVDFELLRR